MRFPLFFPVSLCIILVASAWAGDATTTLFGSLPPAESVRDWRADRLAVPIVTPPSKEEVRREPVTRFAADRVTVQAPPPGRGYVWQVVLLIYPSIDCEQTVAGVTSRFTYTMPQAGIAEAQTALQGMYTGVTTGSNGEARLKLTTVVVGRTLTTLAKFGADIHWPDCTITAPELTAYCAGGKADSAVVYWPSRNTSTGTGINNPYWGLSYGAPASWTYGVGYSTVANISSPMHPAYYPGEVMIHEWLHPVTDYYQTVWGFTVPDLDGAGNYKPSPTAANYAYVTADGWMPFYRDIMKGTVWNPNTSAYVGLPAPAWRSGTPTNYTEPLSAVTDWEMFD